IQGTLALHATNDHGARMSAHAPGLQVLAVDDEVPAVEQMRWLLEVDPLVSAVQTATNVAEARHILAEGNIDVVLLDIHMPGPTGVDLAPEPRRANTGRTPPIVCVPPDARPAVHAFELAALDYLLKPVRPARLHEALRRSLTRVDTGPIEQVPEQGRVAV